MIRHIGPPVLRYRIRFARSLLVSRLAVELADEFPKICDDLGFGGNVGILLVHIEEAHPMGLSSEHPGQRFGPQRTVVTFAESSSLSPEPRNRPRLLPRSWNRWT